MTTESLIERLEAADEMTTDLFCDVWGAMPKETHDGPLGAKIGKFAKAEAWTEAALLLVPEGYEWMLRFPKPFAKLWRPAPDFKDRRDWIGEHETSVALALPIAILKAHEAKGGETDD